MGWKEVLRIIVAAFASVGVSGGIIFAFSSWLGKVWAARIMEKERHQQSSELEKIKRELDIIKENTLRFQSEKLATYRAVTEIVARLLASLDTRVLGRLSQADADTRFDEFNEQRIKVYGYLAMLAPQSVMDALDELMDHLLKLALGTVDWEHGVIRKKALVLLNAIRVDIGISPDPITYKGDTGWISA